MIKAKHAVASQFNLIEVIEVIEMCNALDRVAMHTIGLRDLPVSVKAKKKCVCFRLTHHFLGDRLMFFYCATQSCFIGDHIEKKSKSDHFERSYEVLKTKLSKN